MTVCSYRISNINLITKDCFGGGATSVEIVYDDNGLKYSFRWRTDGRYNRVDGPAVGIYGMNIFHHFFLEGVEYPFGTWIEMVKDNISEERYLELKAEYDDK